jgi:hypothetical protein
MYYVRIFRLEAQVPGLVRSVSRVERARFKETGLESAVVHYFGWLALLNSRVPIMRLAASHFSLLIESS